MNKDKIIGSFVGLAVGDAIGTTLEFEGRDQKEELKDMIGGGVFKLNPGEWTDDTSMALCLSKSLLEKGFDLKDQLEKYLLWRNQGYCSSNGKCFDIGMTVVEALSNYVRTGNEFSGSTDEYSAGNGSIMRLAPIVIYYSTKEHKDNPLFFELLNKSKLSSKTTHQHPSAVDACALLAIILNRGFYCTDKISMLNFTENMLKEYNINDTLIKNIALGSYKSKRRDDIKSSGYVIHSLEAALWAFYNTDNFNDGVLLAANLAGDADTVAAIYGQIAGSFYGVSSIKKDWLRKIKYNTMIIKLAIQLYNKNHEIKVAYGFI